MGKGDVILKDTFQIGNSPHSVLLFHHQLTWCPQKRGTEDMSEWMKVRIQDILAVELLCKNNNVGKEGGKLRRRSSSSTSSTTSLCCSWTCFGNKGNSKSDKSCSSSSSSSNFGQYLTVHFSKRVKDSSKWTRSQIQLSHPDYPVLNHWHQSLLTALNGMQNRPKNFLFFVNPYGGKRKGVAIFERQVKPLLHLCSCKWTVINTQRRNHATEAIASMSDEKIAEYDVVVGVGGDGTICEIVTGLLTRGFPSSKAIDEGDLQPAPVPVAVVPAGSSNALAFTLHGTDDPVTAILHILLGNAAPLDVAAMHNHSGISRFIVGQMSYGHLADTMVYSEKLRWMGPKRYDVAGFRKFLAHSTYQGSVDMRVCVDDSRKIPTQCLGGNCCEDCITAGNRVEGSNGEWKRVEGRFLGISGANISCRCALSPLGMAPFAHLADGHLDLILIRKASRLKHLQYLLRTAGDSRRAFALPFVERYKVDEFIFTPVQCCPSSGRAGNMSNMKSEDVNSPDKESDDVSFPVCGCDSRRTKKHSSWNCDGELWYQPSVRVTVHRNLIRIMSRSPPEVENHTITSSTASASSSVPNSPPLSPTGSDITVPITLSPSSPTKEVASNYIVLTTKEVTGSLKVEE